VFRREAYKIGAMEKSKRSTAINDGRASAGQMGRLVPGGGTDNGREGLEWRIAVVVGVSLAVRLLYDYAIWSVVWTRQLVGDAAGYYEWASRVAGGEWLGGESFYQAPLYPYVLAVLFRVCGESVWVVKVAQGCWGAIAVGLLCRATWDLFGRQVGMVAGWMLGLFGPAIYFDGIVQKASLGCFLTCGLLWGLAQASRAVRIWQMGVVGIVVGLLVVTRENALVWVPLLFVWSGWALAMEGWRGWAGGMAAFTLGVGAVLGPVSVRNWVVSGEWSVSTFQAGPNLYIGNHAGASGLYEPLVRGHETPRFERRDATALAERAIGRELTAREVSRYWTSRAMRDIRSDVGGWLRLLGRKMLMVWNRYEVADAESYYVYADCFRPLRLLGGVWHFGVLCPLAAVGVVATRGQWRRLWIYYALIASMALAVALFYVTARYRFPLVPLLIPFAAVGAVHMWESVRLRSYRGLVVSGVLAAVVAVVVNWSVLDEDRLNALSHMNVGVALAEKGELISATEYFRRAIEGHPQSAEANNNLAQALSLQGEYAEAIPHYRAALAVDPALIGVAYNLAVVLERVGQLEEAVEYYVRAVELDPSDEDARRAVARLRGNG